LTLLQESDSTREKVRTTTYLKLLVSVMIETFRKHIEYQRERAAVLQAVWEKEELGIITRLKPKDPIKAE
jgi:hypothetical protein